MGTKERNFQSLPEDISLEDLVPEDSFYHRLEEKLDLSFARELVEDLYVLQNVLCVCSNRTATRVNILTP